MRLNWIHYTIAALFILFGLVQYNDPDFYKWIPAYFLVAAVPILYARYAFPKYFVFTLWGGFLIWLLLYIPDISDWVDRGMPSITESMKAESPYIELAREFFGLLLCFLVISFYLALFNKRTKS